MGRWLETYCGYCRTPIPYLPEWSFIPEYCRDCNEWQYKTCANPHCGGSVKYKIYWSNIHDYCECNGWYDTRCENNKCFAKFKANCNWDNPPKYCPTCREWQEKPCASPQCNGTVRYRAYWDNISDYCSCKGWYEKNCDYSGCRGTIKIHASWTNKPSFCKGKHTTNCNNPHCNGMVEVNPYNPKSSRRFCSCNGWFKVKCDNPKCNAQVDKHFDSKSQNFYCDYCYKMLQRRGYEQIIRGTRLENWISRGVRGAVRDDGNSWHVTLYLNEGGHVSGNVDKFSTDTWSVHGTLYAYDESGKRVKGEDIIIND